MARDLKLQVVLDAVDRVTRPLKKITEGSSRTAEALKASREQLKTLERAQRDLRSFRELKQQSEETSSALDEQQREIRELSRQMRSAEGDTQALSRKRAQAIRQAKKLKDRYRDEQRQLHELRGSMTRVEGVTGRYSDQQRQLAQKIREANGQLERQKDQLSAIDRQQRAAADAARRYQRAAGRGNAMRGTGATGAAAGGVALTAMGHQAFSNQIDGARLAAQFGENEQEATRYREVITQVYRSGRGESQEQVAQAVSDLGAAFGSLEAQSTEQLREITEQALTLSDVFGIDVAEAAQTAGILVQNGLAKDASAAFDLIGRGFQELSSEMRRELPEILHEYSTNFRALGFDGQEAMSLLVAAAEQGKFALDKTGDALKEFTIRGSDMSKASREAYETVGLDAQAMSDAIASGGDQARQAMQTTAQAILDIEDPARRANTAIALFGTPIEDLSVDQIPQFLKALTSAEDRLGNVAGVTDDMADTLDNNAGKALQRVQRVIAGEFMGVLNDVDEDIIAISRAVTSWIDENPELAATLTKVAAGLAALVAVGGSFLLVAGSLLGPIAMVRYGMEMFGLKTEGAGKETRKASKGGLKVLGGALKWLGRLIAWVGRAFLLNPIGLVVTAIAGAAYLIYRNWNRVGPWLAALWQGIKAKASAMWQWFKHIASAVGDAIKGYFMNWTLPGLLIQHWDTIKATASKLWQWFQDAPSNAIDAVARMLRDWDLKGVLKEKWTAAIDYLKGLPGHMKAAGADLARGLRDGIRDKAGDVWQAVTETAAGTEASARRRLKTHSPSRVFMAIGHDTMAGLQRGIADSERAPLRQVSQFSRRLRQAGAGITMGTLSLPAVAAPEIPKPIIPTIGKPAFTVPDTPVLQGLAELQLTLSELPDMERRLEWPELPSLPELKVQLPDLPHLQVETPERIAIDNRPPLQAASGGDVHITIEGGINVHATPGMDEQTLARMVNAEVRRAIADAGHEAAARRRSSFHDID